MCFRLGEGLGEGLGDGMVGVRVRLDRVRVALCL